MKDSRTAVALKEENEKSKELQKALETQTLHHKQELISKNDEKNTSLASFKAQNEQDKKMTKLLETFND
jgi:hypothetical protein